MDEFYTNDVYLSGEKLLLWHSGTKQIKWVQLYLHNSIHNLGNIINFKGTEEPCKFQLIQNSFQ